VANGRRRSWKFYSDWCEVCRDDAPAMEFDRNPRIAGAVDLGAAELWTTPRWTLRSSATASTHPPAGSFSTKRRPGGRPLARRRTSLTRNHRHRPGSMAPPCGSGGIGTVSSWERPLPPGGPARATVKRPLSALAPPTPPPNRLPPWTASGSADCRHPQFRSGMRLRRHAPRGYCEGFWLRSQAPGPDETRACEICVQNGCWPRERGTTNPWNMPRIRAKTVALGSPHSVCRQARTTGGR